MRISDYRLSIAMKDILVALVTGSLSRTDNNFPAATADALYRRGLLDENFKLLDMGRAVAVELIARQPKTFVEPEMARLIAGLQILQQYEHCARPYPTQRSRRCIALQEEAFDTISDEHRMTLEEIGWEQRGRFEWFF